MSRYKIGDPRPRTGVQLMEESIAACKASVEEENAIEEVRLRRFKKAMALKEDLGLLPEERHELAKMLVGVDAEFDGSWRELNPKQLHDLITMMEGYAFINYILSQRLDTEDE